VYLTASSQDTDIREVRLYFNDIISQRRWKIVWRCEVCKPGTSTSSARSLPRLPHLQSVLLTLSALTDVYKTSGEFTRPCSFGFQAFETGVRSQDELDLWYGILQQQDIQSSEVSPIADFVVCVSRRLLVHSETCFDLLCNMLSQNLMTSFGHTCTWDSQDTSLMIQLAV